MTEDNQEGVCIMAVDFKTSRTRENLMKAFAGESQARNRYTIAAEIAGKQGMQAVSRVFLFTADQERAHAQRFYQLLKEAEGTTVDIRGGYPVDAGDSVTDLLRAAEHNEMEEFQDVYQAFGREAKEEGFEEAAYVFFQIAEIEHVHAKRFARLRELVESGGYFKKEGGGAWMCLNCGYIYEGTDTPELCPVCRHGKGYFIPLEMAPYTGSDIVFSK